MRKEQLNKKEKMFENLEKYFLISPPLPPINAVNLSKIIGIKLEPFPGSKENIKDLFYAKNRYKLTGFVDQETNTIHYNKFLSKPYLNFLVAHDSAHLLGNFPSPPNWDSSDSEDKNQKFEEYRTNPLSETISDTFAYTFLYPRSLFVFSLIEFGIKKTFDTLSKLYPQVNILFKLLFNLKKNSFFIFMDPINNFFSQFTLKIPKTQEIQIIPKKNIISTRNVILSETKDFGTLSWFGNLLDESNNFSHIYINENSKKMMLKQFSDNGLDSFGEHIRKERKFNVSYCSYGYYKFNLYHKKRSQFYSIDSKFFHIIFPFNLIGRTSGKKFLVLTLAIEDNEESLFSYNKENDNILLSKDFIKDFDDKTLTFDIYDWFIHLRENLNLPKKNYQKIYGKWPTIDISKTKPHSEQKIPKIPPPSRN